MATTKLLYRHERNIFLKGQWKAFINKYFKDVKFLGCECGYHYPTIEISNWDEVKDILPKSYQPLEVTPC